MMRGSVYWNMPYKQTLVQGVRTKTSKMNWEDFLIGLILILTGIIILIYQERSGDFGKNANWNQGTVGLIGGAIISIFGGLYFFIGSF